MHVLVDVFVGLEASGFAGGGVDHVGTTVPVDIDHVGDQVRSHEVLQLVILGRLLVSQPCHFAEFEFATGFGHHLRNADDTAQFSPGGVIVRKGADKIETSVAGQVDQPSGKSHRDRPRHAGVVRHQVSNADQWCGPPGQQNRTNSRRFKTDLVGPLVGSGGHPLHTSPVSDRETVSQRMGHDSAGPHLENLNAVGIEDSRPIDCRDHLFEVDKWIQWDLLGRELRGDSQPDAESCRELNRWFGAHRQACPTEDNQCQQQDQGVRHGK